MHKPFCPGVSGVSLAWILYSAFCVKYSSKVHESVLCIKMLLCRNLLVVICGVIIASGADSGTEKKKEWGAVGGEVSFGPDKSLPASVTSITWKHIKGGETVKAIEWEDGLTETPNPRFKDITTLNTATGQITIKKLKFEHSGNYTIDISGKEQAQGFTLTLIEPVPQPVIKVDPTDNPNVVYLKCEYSETVIWKNSAGQILKGSQYENTITVEKNGKPDEFYTCTLENKASSKTSEKVYERDLFKDQSGGGHTGLIVTIVVILILLIICGIGAILYKRDPNLIGSVVARCPCSKVNPPKNPDEGNVLMETKVENPPKNPDAGNAPLETKVENPPKNPDAGNAPLETKVENPPQNPDAGNAPLENV